MVTLAKQTRGVVSPSRRIILGWRILQGLFLVGVAVSLWQQHCVSTLGVSSSILLELPIHNTNNNASDDFYTRPLSDRVPAHGIETVLATSATDPPFHYFLHAPRNDYLAARVLETGLYEKDSTTALIDAIVCPSSGQKNNTNNKPLLVLDLGANIGFHSLHMAACGARVLSFEASPDTAWLLQSSARLNGWSRDRPSPQESHTVTLVPRGVSNATSTARLKRFPQSPGMTSFVAADKTSFDLQDATALDVDIPLVRAQDVLHAMQVSPSTYHLRFAKIDVEGFEFQALKGLDLSQFPVDYLAFEFFPALLKAGGTDPVELLVYIWNQGYRYVKFDATKKLEEYERVKMGTTKAQVRQWAERVVRNGYKVKQDGYHVNLLAQRVR